MLGAQPIFTIHAELEPIMNLGHALWRAAGDRHQRRHRARGEAQWTHSAGGSDCRSYRADGAADIQARYTIESDTGARILVYSAGPAARPPEDGAIGKRRQCRSVALLFPHRAAVETANPRSNGSTAFWGWRGRARGAGGAARRLRGGMDGRHDLCPPRSRPTATATSPF